MRMEEQPWIFADIMNVVSLDSAARAFSTGEKTSFGGLSDQDRIFTNLYGMHDPGLKVRAMLRKPLDVLTGYGLQNTEPDFAIGSVRLQRVYICMRNYTMLVSAHELAALIPKTDIPLRLTCWVHMRGS